MNAAQASEILGITRFDVWRAAGAGKIPATKVGHNWVFDDITIRGIALDKAARRHERERRRALVLHRGKRHPTVIGHAETAAVLGVSENTVRNMILDGRLPAQASVPCKRSTGRRQRFILARADVERVARDGFAVY